MALNRDSIAFLVAAHAAGVSFDDTLMLGRQVFLPDERALQKGFADAGVRIELGEARRLFADGWSESFFHHLGANRVDSLDASAYEQASIIHDLNKPLPDELRARYSAVIDGGTLEHVFNFPTALRNALDAVRVGGHYIALTPANNHFGHGFYQFSPELYFRVFAPENGFRVRCVLMRGYNSGAHWYRVADPAVVGHRTIAFSSWPVVLYVLATRVAEVDVLASTPQQSDYVETWDVPRSARGGLRKRLSHAEPIWLKDLRITALTAMFRRSFGDFKRVKLEERRTFAEQ